MKRPKHVADHIHAPKAWRHTPNITGDYDLDASIMHGKHSPAMMDKLQPLKENAYGPKSGYDGYNGYHGDD